MYYWRLRDRRDRKGKKKKRLTSAPPKVGQWEIHSKGTPMQSLICIWMHLLINIRCSGSKNNSYSDSLPHSPFEELSPK